jgi:hypothetical protein
MSYLIDKFKGQYRLMVEYDRNSNQFNRKANGTFEDIDVYIDCANNTRVFYFGDGLLECYVMSLGRGRNVIKNIYSDFVKDIESSKYMTIKEASGKKTTVYDYESLYKDKDLNEIITDIYETDEEVIFKFYWDKMEMFEKYLKPKTSAADRSPFSLKNLPRTDYTIPSEDLEGYKKIVQNLGRENVILVSHKTTAFMKSLVNQNNTWEDIKADMALKGIKGKDYIHSIGKWEEYVNYLKDELCQI